MANSILHQILLIIPARYASTRLPGKALADIAGQTMIRRVYQQAQKAKNIDRILIATDDERIAQEVKKYNGDVVFTSPYHLNGTARVAEAASLYPEYDYIINLQGDEPFIAPESIDLLAQLCIDKQPQIATLFQECTNINELLSPHTAKVVFNENHQAMYFSRHAVPYQRDVANPELWLKQTKYWLHVGMYAFKSDVLQKLVRLPAHEVEQAEQLEQLRWLLNGYRIDLAQTQWDTFSVDTPDDLTQACLYATDRGL